jgi:hypothetical protein
MFEPNYTPTSNVISESKILDCFEKHLNKNKEIHQILDQILSDFQSYDGNRFMFKCVGTIVSVMGAGGLVLASLDTGLPLKLTWIGGVMVGSGFLINWTTEITNYYESKGTIKEVIRLATTHNSYTNKGQKVLENLMKYAELIKVRENLTNNQAIGKALHEHMNKRITFSEANGSLGIAHPTEALAVIPYPSQQTRHGIVYSVLLSGGESAGMAAVQIFTTADTWGKVFKYGGIGLSVVSAVIDILLLNKVWMSTHPTIEKIKEIEDKLKGEITKLQRNIEIIRRCAAEGGFAAALRGDNLDNFQS